MAIEQIGTYRHVLAAGEPMLYGEKPIYGQREKYLHIPRKTAHQVMVRFLRWYTWINVDAADVTLH